MSTLSDIQRDLGQVKRDLRDLEQTSRANFGSTAVAIRRTRQQLVNLELARSVDKLRPPTSLLDWTPRLGEPAKPALSDSLLDRLRKGEAVADSLGNTEPFVGRTNLLADATMEGLYNVSTALTTSDTVLARAYNASGANGSFRGTKTVATAATVTTTSYGLRDSTVVHYFSSAALSVDIDPTGSGTHTGRIKSAPVDLTASPQDALPYLIGGCAVFIDGFADLTDVTSIIARVRLFNVINGTYDASDELDMTGLPEFMPVVLQTSLRTADFFPLGDQYELHIEVEIVTTSGNSTGLALVVGEPRMHFGRSPDVQSYTPQLGTWQPQVLTQLSFGSGTATFIESRLRTDSNTSRFLVDTSGATEWGPGTAVRDVRLERSATATLQLSKTTAAGAGSAALTFEGATTPPGTPATGFGMLWFDTATKHFFQRDDAGVDTDLAAGGGGGPVTQVSRDASTGSSDYVARIRLGTDTTYRAFLGLDSADRGLLEFGPGGVAARDLRLMRASSGQLSLDSIGASTATQLTIQATSGQQAIAALQVSGDSFVRTSLRGDASVVGIQLGDGTAAADLQASRLSYASKVHWSFQNPASSTVGGSLLVTGYATSVVGQAQVALRIAGDTGYRLRLTTSVDGSGALPGALYGDGSAEDLRAYRGAAGTFDIDSNGASATTALRVSSTSGQQAVIRVFVAGDSNGRAQFRGDASLTGLQFGSGAASPDWTLARDAADQASLSSGDILNLTDGHLNLPQNNTGSSVLGRLRWSTSATAGQRVFVYDSQRDRDVMELGWAPYAVPPNFVADAAFTTAVALPVSGGSIAIPIAVVGHMLVQSLTHRVTAASGTGEARVYRQRLNNGNSGENTLDEVTGLNVTIAAAGAAATVTTNVGTPGTYLPPGLYWLVIRCTSGATALNLGSTAASAAFAVNSAQTKTLGAALGATLDFVAATWTKVTAIYAVRLNGRVFGQTAAF